MREYDIYKSGIEAYRVRDYRKAKNYFNMLLNSGQYRFNALRMLLKINARYLRYRDAREIIEEEMYQDDYNTVFLLANLNRSELNLNESIELLKICRNSCTDKYGILIELVNSYICNGEFNKAREVLRELDEIEEVNKNVILLKYIMIDIILGNYERAFSNFGKVDVSQEVNQLKALYEKVYIILNFYLGNDIKDINFLNSTSNPFKSVLYDEEDFTRHLLAQRIDRNKMPSASGLVFSGELDASKFLDDIKDRICKTNPLYQNFMNVYQLRLPYSIGYNGDEEISDVSVSTVMGTDKIIKISPALFSDEFDREGMSRDRDLRKRLKIN